MASSAADEAIAFLAGYPPPVAETALALRRLVHAALPDVGETLDRSARIVGYGYGPGYQGLVCTIIPGRGGVKLGLADGAGLPDPDGLLAGTGKRHRHVAFSTAADVARSGVRRLLDAAFAAWNGRHRA